MNQGLVEEKERKKGRTQEHEMILSKNSGPESLTCHTEWNFTMSTTTPVVSIGLDGLC